MTNRTKWTEYTGSKHQLMKYGWIYLLHLLTSGNGLTGKLLKMKRILNKILCFFKFHDYSLEYTFAYKKYPPLPYFVCKHCGALKYD